MLKFTLAMFFGLLCSVSSAQHIQYSNKLNHFASASHDRFGREVIQLNSRLRFRPKLQEFIINHERAHFELNHFRSNKPILLQEIEADRYATQRSSMGARRAAYRFFLLGGGSGFNKSHGSSWSRARRIRNY